MRKGPLETSSYVILKYELVDCDRDNEKSIIFKC